MGPAENSSQEISLPCARSFALLDSNGLVRALFEWRVGNGGLYRYDVYLNMKHRMPGALVGMTPQRFWQLVQSGVLMDAHEVIALMGQPFYKVAFANVRVMMICTGGQPEGVHFDEWAIYGLHPNGHDYQPNAQIIDYDAPSLTQDQLSAWASMSPRSIEDVRAQYLHQALYPE
jgi:hypothetical protein